MTCIVEKTKPLELRNVLYFNKTIRTSKCIIKTQDLRPKKKNEKKKNEK